MLSYLSLAMDPNAYDTTPNLKRWVDEKYRALYRADIALKLTIAMQY